MLKVFNFDATPIVDIINDILVDASKRGASDVHFDSHDGFMRCRIRIDGQLIDYADVPQRFVRNLITRIKIISGMNITESRLPQDGAIKTTIKETDLDLRVASIPTSNGEKIVLRILDYQRSLNGLETLGFNEENYHKVIEMTESPNGIILVTGATGSGKSTTVYSMLQRLNKEENNLITIEDPIEMDIDGINQIQTNPEIGLTFATALRAILRQDPNVIMVGEIRDSETAQIAIRAAITGHLVLSTLHTNDALSTIERLMDMDVERYLLASSLTGIIAQRLARHLCDHCKKLRPTNDFEKKLFKIHLHQDVNEIYEAVGCDQCNSGYKDRIAIHEVLYISQEIKDALNQNIDRQEFRKLIYNNNVITLLEDGLQKVLKGFTSIEEVLKLMEIEELVLEEEKNDELENNNNDNGNDNNEFAPSFNDNTDNNNNENNNNETQEEPQNIESFDDLFDEPTENNPDIPLDNIENSSIANESNDSKKSTDEELVFDDNQNIEDEQKNESEDSSSQEIYISF